MIDLSKEKIDVKCSCGKVHKASLQDVINRKNIRCICGTTIQLKDSDGSVKKSVHDMNKAFKDLDNTLKRFGKF